MKRRFVALVATVLGVAAGAGTALAQAANPVEEFMTESGINFSTLISNTVAVLGAIVAGVLAAWFCFLCVRKGMGWGRRVG